MRLLLAVLIGTYLAIVGILLATALFNPPIPTTPPWSWSTAFHA